MRLGSSDGAWVLLEPIGYQFAQGPDTSDWDANWLIIRGAVNLADERAYEFENPCLTTWEANELGRWLYAALAGDVPVAAAPWDEADLLTFTEPKLAFSLAERVDASVTLRVHLSLGVAPPWLSGPHRPSHYEYVVPLSMSEDALLAAAAEWEQQIETWPTR